MHTYLKLQEIIKRGTPADKKMQSLFRH